jgi:hypothetical protein
MIILLGVLDCLVPAHNAARRGEFRSIERLFHHRGLEPGATFGVLNPEDNKPRPFTSTGENR